jgi:hypothetical protein
MFYYGYIIKISQIYVSVMRKKRDEKTGSCPYEISWVTASSESARQQSKCENGRKLRTWHKKQRNLS